MANNKPYYEEIIIAGFGGQGIMLAGKLLAQAAMISGKEVTYMPSYGAEVRGGTANCILVIADEQVASPMFTKADTAIVMNKASLIKFAPAIKAGGLLVTNSSLIDIEPEVDKSIEILKVPADDIAVELGNQKIANMVILGAYLQKRGVIRVDKMADCLADVLANRLHNTIPLNTQALLRGAEFAKANKTIT